MADDSCGLFCLDELPDEIHCVAVRAELVRSDGATRNDERIVIVGGDLGEGFLHLERVTRVEVVVDGLDLAGFGTDDIGARPGVLDGSLRFGELDFLGASLCEEDSDVRIGE